MKPKRYVVIGYGNVGGALVSHLSSREDFELHQVVKSDGVYNSEMSKVADTLVLDPSNIDVGFLCIPSMGYGEIAYAYIKSFVDARIPIVVCEKAALANYFQKIRLHASLTGFRATVGAGGTFLPLVQKHSREINKMQIVLNGTLQFLWSSMAQGLSFEYAVAQAREKGFLEPNHSQDRLSIVNSELEDVFRKSVICFNAGHGRRFVSCKELNKPSLTREEVAELIAFAPDYRPYVEIGVERTRCLPTHMRIYRLGQWFIHLGFVRVDDTNFGWNEPRGQFLRNLGPDMNAISIHTKRSGVHICLGPGAGVDTTVQTMIRDAERLLDMASVS